jgi:sugar lactone lactonase YvrE
VPKEKRTKLQDAPGANIQRRVRKLTAPLVLAAILGILGPARLAALQGLSTDAITVGSAAGSPSVVLTTTGSWTAAANDSFLHISPGSANGTGSAVVVFTIDAFAGTGTRNGTLTISGMNLAVTQVGTNWTAVYPFETLGTTSLTVGSAAGSGSVEIGFLPVDATAPWTASTADSWLHVTTGSGTGGATIQFTLDANPNETVRTGTITIDSGLALTVAQVGTNYIAASPVTTLASGLNWPTGVAVDGLGNVYIAEWMVSVIKEWKAATLQVTTLVPSGLWHPWAVAVDGSGNVYIADGYNNAIKEWSAATQQVTTLVSSGLSDPRGVAVDGSGNVYIADTANHLVKKWSAATQQVTTLVPSGLHAPYGLAVDCSGNLYIADINLATIQKWSAATQQVTTLVSSGLHDPYGVAVDGSGNVYIANEQWANGIQKWSAATQTLTTLTWPGPLYPAEVAMDGSGNLYASDDSHGTIDEINFAFVGPASLTEPASAGTDSLLPVLPATTSLNGLFAPASDQTWLTIGTISNGVVSFSFTANTSGSSRTAHITVLGQQIAVTQISGVTPGSQTITFGSLSSQALGTAAFTVSATASSGLPVSFASTTTSVCTVSGTTVTLVAVGQCSIQASQAGNASYAAATPVTESFQVTVGSQTITFGPLSSQALGTAAFTVSASASSGLPVSFASTTTSVCTVSGTTVTLVAAGQCSIQASQAGNANYAAATPVTRSFTVTKATPTITWSAPASITYGGALGNGQLNASASVPGTFVYVPPAGTVLPVGNGQTLSVTFTPADAADYTTATASTTINVNAAPPTSSGVNLVVTKVLQRTGGNVVVQLTIANTGGTGANNVTLTSVKVGSVAATPLPQNIGTVGAGASAQAIVSVPGSVGVSGAASSLTAAGTYTGGTFSVSTRITLP